MLMLSPVAVVMAPHDFATIAESEKTTQIMADEMLVEHISARRMEASA